MLPSAFVKMLNTYIFFPHDLDTRYTGAETFCIQRMKAYS